MGRRKYGSLLVMMCMSFILILGACSSNQPAASGGSPASGAAAKETQQAQPKAPVTLKFSIWGNDSQKAMYEEIAARFKEVQPHVNVEIMQIPFGDYQQNMSILLASNSAPDIAWLSERMIPQFIVSGDLKDISAVKQDANYHFEDIFASTLELLQDGDALYGLPFSTPPVMIFYNKKLFDQHGLKTPKQLYQEGNWTYDEFLKAARTIADVPNGIYGVNMISNWNSWSDNLLPIFWSYGADLFDETGTKFMLNTEAGRQALQLFYDMIFVDKVHPKPGDQVVFEAGKLGMFRGIYSNIGNYQSIEDFEWDIAPLPEGPSGNGRQVGFAGYTVFESTKHPEEAVEFLKFVTNEESMTKTSQYFVPSRKTVFESESFINQFERPGEDSIRMSVIEQMEGARPKPGHVNWQQIDVEIQENLDYLYAQSLSVEEVLKQMEQGVAPLLK